MDYIHVCYSSTMRTIDGADPVEGGWFPAPPGAVLAPGPHAYGSSIWRGKVVVDGKGEQQTMDDWTRRRNIAWRWPQQMAPYTGRTACAWPLPAHDLAVPGRDEVFQTNDLGQATCCASGVHRVWQGGSAEGGTWPALRLVRTWQGGSAEGGRWPTGLQYLAAGDVIVEGAAVE